MVTLQSNLCPIVTVKSLDSSLKSKIQVELDSHTDTSVLGSNVLVVHNYECHNNVFEYDNKSRRKNVTTVVAAVVYKNPQTRDTSVMFINQAIMIPSIKNC